MKKGYAILTKEQIRDLIKGNRSILQKDSSEYLYRLVNLSEDALAEDLPQNVQKSLGNLDVYRYTVLYSLAERTKGVMESIKGTHPECFITWSDDEIIGEAIISDKPVQLLHFVCGDYYVETSKDLIGGINLFEYLDGTLRREKVLRDIMSNLDILYDEQNPFVPTRRSEDAFAKWEQNHAAKVAFLEQKFNELSIDYELSDDDKKKMEISAVVFDALLDEFKLDATKDLKKDAVSVGELMSMSKLQPSYDLTQTRGCTRSRIRIKDNRYYL